MGWEKALKGDVCLDCGFALEQGEDVYEYGDDVVCEGCNEERLDDDSWDESDYRERGGYEDDYLIDGVGFADPGGRSALRAATASNPRNLPCPTCHAENRLTSLDRARGYQCDSCADRAEGYGY